MLRISQVSCAAVIIVNLIAFPAFSPITLQKLTIYRTGIPLSQFQVQDDSELLENLIAL